MNVLLRLFVQTTRNRCSRRFLGDSQFIPAEGGDSILGRLLLSIIDATSTPHDNFTGSCKASRLRGWTSQEGCLALRELMLPLTTIN